MAIQKQVNMLRQGTAIWNVWRREHPDEKIDLRGANLRGTDLSSANFSDANLSNTNLSNADLSNAELRLANLYSADLLKANLYRADLHAFLREANLKGTNLQRADLTRADLRGVDLSYATTAWTHFDDIDLSQVKGLEHIQHQGPSYISTSTLSRSQGNIPDVFLRGAGLDNTFIEYTRSLKTKAIDYYTCFISYSSKDESFARQLHNGLQQEGVRCWFAPEDMDIGDKIRHRIDESIRSYNKLLLILSESSIESSWVEYEVEQALNKEQVDMPHVLYPIRVDKTILTCRKQWARDIKETRHIGDFENWTDPHKYGTSFQKLLRALNSKKESKKQ